MNPINKIIKESENFFNPKGIIKRKEQLRKQEELEELRRKKFKENIDNIITIDSWFLTENDFKGYCNLKHIAVPISCYKRTEKNLYNNTFDFYFIPSFNILNCPASIGIVQNNFICNSLEEANLIVKNRLLVDLADKELRLSTISDSTWCKLLHRMEMKK